MLEKLIPTAFYFFNGAPFILFYLNPANKDDIFEKVWNFNHSPIIVIIEDYEISVFNGFKLLHTEGILEKLGDETVLNAFTYLKLVTGRTWEDFQEKFKPENRIDFYLLKNIESARILLINQYNLDKKVANSLIGKCIFVRYLIDRKIKITFKGITKIWTNQEFCNLFVTPILIKDFFTELSNPSTGFGKEIFPIQQCRYEDINIECYTILASLLQGDDLGNGQKSLFQLYDFSILPIEFISHVYEHFIGKENQEDSGSYYTPLFLVDYILKNSVEKHLSLNELKDGCKVLDPSCGSGIFLVETLRKIIEKHKINNPSNHQDNEKWKSTLCSLATENIFGIDLNEEAINVAVFSVYLTLLDYQNPPQIENFTFPQLLEENFFISDFFDLKAEFNERLKGLKFDFILGNPPWKGGGIGEKGKEYINHRKKIDIERGRKYQSAVNNGEVAEGFMLRVSDFCGENTKITLIIRSLTLYSKGYNAKESPFRSYWLEEFFIDKVLELAQVRYEVFNKSNDSAVAPAAVVSYRYAFGKNTNENVLEHLTLRPSLLFSLFQVFSLSRNDYKRVKQTNLKIHDWLWKVLVFGNYLDYNLIKRLNSVYKPIKELVEDENRFLVGTGVQYSKNEPYNSEHLKGKDFIDVYGVMPFYINNNKISSFNRNTLHRIRPEILFKAPLLLVRKGLDTKTYQTRSAVTTKDLIFKDSITGIRALDSADTAILKQIMGILSSNIYTYFAINTFASIGIEREQTQNYDRFSVPYISYDYSIIEEIEKTTKELEKQKADKNLSLPLFAEGDTFYIKELEEKLTNLRIELNSILMEALELSDREESIIDYTLNITRNIINREKNEIPTVLFPIKYKSTVLESYANVYLERFTPLLSTQESKFYVEIWHTEYLVAMFFKNSSNNSDKSITWGKNKNDIDILSFFAAIGSEKLTDGLFVRKDVRGFEGDYFFIVKPNDLSLWHKSIAYIDVDEFMDAILKQHSK